MINKSPSTADEFQFALEEHAPRFGINLEQEAVARLREYYEQVMAWNARLHLVAPCPPAEFATRHVLESLIASPYLKQDSSVTDVGSGAGLPIIPCLITRSDLRAILIESSHKKAVFLREALRETGAGGARAKVLSERFLDTPRPETDYVTSRALDRFTEVLPQLVEWSTPGCTLLLFGGETLRTEIEKLGLSYEAARVPESERRFLFIARRR